MKFVIFLAKSAICLTHPTITWPNLAILVWCFTILALLAVILAKVAPASADFWAIWTVIDAIRAFAEATAPAPYGVAASATASSALADANYIFNRVIYIFNCCYFAMLDWSSDCYFVSSPSYLALLASFFCFYISLFFLSFSVFFRLF